jgi:uncharacterized membrane protein (DUF4010 family)
LIPIIECCYERFMIQITPARVPSHRWLREAPSARRHRSDEGLVPWPAPALRAADRSGSRIGRDHGSDSTASGRFRLRDVRSCTRLPAGLIRPMGGSETAMDANAPPLEVLHVLETFATALGIGLLVGLERERRPATAAGLRTFALTGLFGCVAAVLATQTGATAVLAIGLALVGAMTILATLHDREASGDPGTTTVVAIGLTYILGAVVWHGYAAVAVPAALVMTTLLYFKAELRGLSERLTRRDIVSVLQFGVLTFIVLPLLPDRTMGPFAAFNPHQVWLMVVLVSGVSLAGYIALRVAGPRYGAVFVGLFGGLVSSTATALLYARRARESPATTAIASVVIVVASTIVLVRLGLLMAILAPGLLVVAFPLLIAGFVPGVVVAAWYWRTLAHTHELPLPEVRNPTELGAALTFGALYAVVLVISAWLADTTGDRGLYALAFASGLTDVDAITLSSLRLRSTSVLTDLQTLTAIVIAILANIALKTALVFGVGGRTIGSRVAVGMLVMVAGLGAGLFWLGR